MGQERGLDRAGSCETQEAEEAQAQESEIRLSSRMLWRRRTPSRGAVMCGAPRRAGAKQRAGAGGLGGAARRPAPARRRRPPAGARPDRP